MTSGRGPRPGIASGGGISDGPPAASARADTAARGPPAGRPARPRGQGRGDVSATRTDRRLQDEPLRVEVIAGEEIEEKALMTPGSVAMLLGETTGLRVQTTAPSLGAANVRVQGLRGRYAQLLADGLPLYGAGGDSLGLLQVPPLDLGQVEVIKGAASALYGPAALGGVINLVSRRPQEAKRRRSFNVTSHGGRGRHVLARRRARRRAGRGPRSAASTGSSVATSTTTAGPICRRSRAASCGRGFFYESGTGTSLFVTGGRDRRGPRRRHDARRSGARRRPLRAGAGYVPRRRRGASDAGSRAGGCSRRAAPTRAMARTAPSATCGARHAADAPSARAR